MKKLFLICLLPLTLCVGCKNTNKTSDDKLYSYGAFLGRSSSTKGMDQYRYVSIDVDEFSDKDVKALSNSGTRVMAYLNVGSLETYRSYYSSFSKYTFADYENWDDERWIDVTQVEWQNYIKNNLATSFKNRGCYGVYMDNVDVYSVSKEMYGEANVPEFVKVAKALKSIIDSVNSLGLKVMINGGSELIDDYIDELITTDITSNVWAYHQEEVFSVIEDYDKDIFGKQDNGDKTYYQMIARKMKEMKKEVFFLEYTKDESLIKEIKDYCNEKGYNYYVSSTVNLE